MVELDSSCDDTNNSWGSRFLRWIGVFVLPIPLFLFLIAVSGCVAALITQVFGVESICYGIYSFVAGLLTTAIVTMLSPAWGRGIAIFWAVTLSLLNVLETYSFWDDLDMIQKVSNVSAVVSLLVGVVAVLLMDKAMVKKLIACLLGLASTILIVAFCLATIKLSYAIGGLLSSIVTVLTFPLAAFIFWPVMALCKVGLVWYHGLYAAMIVLSWAAKWYADKTLK